MIAPELIIGLNGRFVPFCSSMALNASPLGSTPTCSATPFVAEVLERHAERERLGDRLQRERLIAVAGLEDLAVGGDDADAEMIGIRVAELGNVKHLRKSLNPATTVDRTALSSWNSLGT